MNPRTQRQRPTLLITETLFLGRLVSHRIATQRIAPSLYGPHAHQCSRALCTVTPDHSVSESAVDLFSLCSFEIRTTPRSLCDSIQSYPERCHREDRQRQEQKETGREQGVISQPRPSRSVSLRRQRSIVTICDAVSTPGTSTFAFLDSIGLPSLIIDRRLVQKTKLTQGRSPCKHLALHNGPSDAPRVLSLGLHQTSQYDPSPQLSAGLLGVFNLEPQRPRPGQAIASKGIAAATQRDQV